MMHISTRGVLGEFLGNLPPSGSANLPLAGEIFQDSFDLISPGWCVDSHFSAHLVCLLSCGTWVTTHVASVTSAMHLFFCWRIWQLRKSVILPIFISAVSQYFRPLLDTQRSSRCRSRNGRLCWHARRFKLGWLDQGVYLYLSLGYYPRTCEDSGTQGIYNCKSVYCLLRLSLTNYA